MASFPSVLILCGGLGTRMNSAYPDLPKAMIPINGEPFIAHQLRLLAKQSIYDVILCVGHRSNSLVEYLGSGKAFGMNVSYSYDGEKLLGTGGAIRQVSIKLAEPFAVLYGDSYLDTDFAPIFDAFRQSDKLALMTVFKNENRWIPSNLLCDSGLVIAYSKERALNNLQYVDYGLSFYYSEVFASFPAHEAFDLAEVTCSLIKRRQLAAYEVKERFYEAGSKKGLRELEEYLSHSQQ